MRRYRINRVQIVIFTIAIIFIAIGVYKYEPIKTLKKAIIMCLECMGIG